MTLLVEEVPEALAGQRIDRVVAMFTGLSRAAATELVAAGAVRVDGRALTGRAEKLAVGALVEIDLPDEVADLGARPDPSVELDIVYVDDDIIVIDKPQGLVVHPGAGNDDGTLAQGVLARYPEVAGVGDPHRPGIVHRLDKGTSGLMVVARSAAAYERLVALLQDRTVERTYLALAWGHPESPQGVIDAPIGRSQREPTRMTVSTRGKEARTRYEVRGTYREPADVTLFACQLETGRTHQIRVHLSAIGHPVVGDGRYGGARQSLPLARPFLHATRLSFPHPVSGEPMAFDSPLPSDLAQVLQQLRP